MVTRALGVRGVLAVALVLGLAWPSAAQDDHVGIDADVRFERLDGLSHNTVTSILQDREGFLWLGTSDGLNRYDGYGFTVYRHDPRDTTSLSNNVVKVLLEDRAGQLWIGTDAGLDRLDRRTGGFQQMVLRPARAQPAVFALLEDRQGRLWVGTADGLYRYEPGAARFTAYRHDQDDPHSRIGDTVWSLYEGRDGALWMSTRRPTMLHRYDPQADQFARYPLPDAWDYVSVHDEDETGRLWLSAGTEVGVFDPEAGRLLAHPEAPPVQAMRVVLHDRQGVRWIGTGTGLHRYDPATGERQDLRIDPAPGAYLQNSVQALYADRAGALWVGTLSGLYRYDPHAKPFRHLGHDPADPNSLTSNTVMAVVEDADGLLWVGTLGGGLDRVNRRMGLVTHYEHRAGDAGSLCHDRIWSLYDDRRGRLWIGTDAGLCVLDRRTRRFRSFDLLPEAPGAGQPPIHAVREDRDGRIWVGSSTGLYRLDPASGDATRYAPPGNALPASGTFFVQSLHVDRSEALWVGTFGGGLYRFDPGTEAFTRYPLLLSEGEELVSEGIWAIHQDRDGTLWLGSDLGLTRLDPQTGAVRHVTQRDGLPGSIVYAVLVDERGDLWLSTNDGLVRFSPGRPPDRALRRYDQGDGLKNAEFNRRAAFKGHHGTFYFGGLGGLTWFHPAAIRENPVVSPVVLTRIETSNRDTTVAVNPFGLDELVLSYRDYTLAFEYAALNFTNPSKNRYRYRLDGFDDGWIEAGTSRRARYTNIPPGRYRFRLQGSNNDGVWNEAGMSLAVTVRPPFWRTWWFRVLVLAGVIGGLVAAHRYRVVRLIEVERMRMRIAQDLHDDIGSGLSSIALASELAGRDAQLSEDKRRHFALVTNKARHLANALTDIVWLVDPAQDRLDDLIDHLEESTRTLLVGLDYTFERPAPAPSHPVDPDVRRNVYLLYKEILHNIVKHAQATKVDIALEMTGHEIVLTVADDGVGFEQAAMHDGYGVKNMQQRAAQIGGSLAFSGYPGEGTTVRFAARLS